MSAMERVKAQAGPAAGVQPWTEVTVSGMEFFRVRVGQGQEESSYGVAVAGEALLHGKDAMAAAVARGAAGAADLARLCALFLVGRGEPLMAAADPRHGKAGAQAPAVDSGVLTYFWDDYGISSRTLMRTRVTLATWDVETVDVEPPEAPAGDAVGRAATLLAGGSTTMHRGAIEILAGACQDPAAVALLARTVREHKTVTTRQLAAEALGGCPGDAAVQALVQALASDADPGVRWRAAASLGRLGDAAARPALEKAASDPDANVSHAAKKALAQLK